MAISLILTALSWYFLGLGFKILFWPGSRLDLMALAEIFGWGFGLAGLVLLGCSLTGVSVSGLGLFFLSQFLFGLALIWRRPRFKETALSLGRRPGLKIGLIGLLMVWLIGLTVKSFSEPVWGWDAYAVWLARARAFFVDGRVSLVNLKWFFPAEHPPLWSLVVYWLYIFQSGANEVAVRFLPLLIYFLILVGFYRNVQAKPVLRWLLVLVLAVMPQLVDNVAGPNLAGNADLLLSLYFFLGIIKLRKKEFSQAGLLFSLAGWVKNDGAPAVVIFVLLMIVFKFKERFKPVLLALAPLLFLFVFKKLAGIQSRYFQDLYSRPYLEYLWYDLMAFREEFRRLSNWNLLWWTAFLVLAVRAREIVKDKVELFAWLMIFGQLASYIFIFLITPEDQAGHIASAIYRLLLHLGPALWLVTGSQLSLLLQSRQSWFSGSKA